MVGARGKSILESSIEGKTTYRISLYDAVAAAVAAAPASTFYILFALLFSFSLLPNIRSTICAVLNLFNFVLPFIVLVDLFKIRLD